MTTYEGLGRRGIACEDISFMIGSLSRDIFQVKEEYLITQLSKHFDVPTWYVRGRIHEALNLGVVKRIEKDIILITEE